MFEYWSINDTTGRDITYWKERALAARVTSMDSNRSLSSDDWADEYHSDILYSGWLIKRGHHFKNFKRRLFCLFQHELVYFDGHDSTDVRGRMGISNSSTLTYLPHNGFQIAQDRYKMILYAADRMSRDAWISHIEKCGVQVINSAISSGDEEVRDASQEVTLCSGWLRKRGQFVKSHKRRFFVLSGKTLSYYISPEKTVRRGVLFVNQATIRKTDTAKTGERYSFVIEAAGRTMQLFADGAEDRENWIAYLTIAAETQDSRTSNPLLAFRENRMSSTAGSTRDIRMEVKLLLASPYSPEGTTGAQYLKNASSVTTIENVREFMDGMTRYILSHRLGYLMHLGSAESIDELKSNIIQVIHEEVEEFIFYPLCKVLYHQIRYKLGGKIKQLRDKITILKEKKQTFFGIPAKRVSRSCWNLVIAALDEIDQVTLPHVKCTKLMEASNLIYTVSASDHPDHESISADDFIPILIYCVVNANVEDWLSLKELLVAFAMNDGQGERDYYITCLEIALEYISSLNVNTSVVLDTDHLGLEFKTNQDVGLILIDKIEPGSKADECPSIHIGDVIVAMDGVCLQDKTLEEFMTMLQSIHGPVELCIEPNNNTDRPRSG